MNIPKEYADDHRFRFKYNEKGKCPRCNARLTKQEQAGAMPPNLGCYACGYHDWDFKGHTFNTDLAIGR
jgi:hypothetical protein